MVRPRKEAPLVKNFLARRVLTLDELCERLDLSRATVLRRLKEHGYYSSYNQSGCFFTIEEAAEFDARGLWHWKAARFSRHGNLKATIRHFVESSEAGMTHQELAAVLGVRVHNSLLELVREKRIRRDRLGLKFVYFSRTASVRNRQTVRRKPLVEERAKPRPTSRQIIAVLLELIKDPKAALEEITIRCQRSGVSISRELVEAIFAVYELDKKRAR
jgi:hypothetical protein